MRVSSQARRTVAGAALLVLLSGVLAGGANPASGQTAPLLTLPGGDSATYLDNGNVNQQVTLVYPAIVASGVDVANLTVAPLSITRDDAVDPSAAQSQFSPRFAFEAPSGPRIEVVVNPGGAPIAAGTYAIKLRLSLKSTTSTSTPDAAATTAGQRADILTVKVLHPAAALAPITPIIVERVVGLWGTSGGTATVHMAETSNKSGLGAIGISAEEPVERNGVTQPVQVVKKPSEALGSIGPGAHKDVELKIGGRPPLGTSKARMQIDAPQLSAPAKFTVEIRRRLALPYLGLLALAGVAFGIVTRIWLAARVQNKRAELAGLQRLAQLKRIEAEAHDSVYMTKLKAATLDLAVVIEAYGEASEVTAAVEKAKADLKTAQDDLAARRTEQDTRRKALDEQLRPARALPRTIGDEVTRLVQLLKGVKDELDRDNAEGARSRLDDVERDIRVTLRDRLDEWAGPRRAIKAGLTGLALPKQKGQALREAADELEKALKEATEGAVTKNDIGGRLGAIEQAVTRLGAVLTALQTMRLKLLALAEPIGDHSAVIQAAADVDVALRAYGDANDKPTSWNDVQVAVKSLLDSFRMVLLVDHAGEEKKAISKLLEDGDFEGAAAAAAAADDPKLSQQAPALIAPDRQDELALLDYGGVLIYGGETESIGPRREEAIADSPLMRTRRQLFAAQKAQTILLGLVAIAVAYAIFAGKWVGTVGDLTAVFLWGFAADVTANGLLETAKKTQPAAPAGPVVPG